jgi:hypothetical protein
VAVGPVLPGQRRAAHVGVLLSPTGADPSAHASLTQKAQAHRAAPADQRENDIAVHAAVISLACQYTVWEVPPWPVP